MPSLSTTIEDTSPVIIYSGSGGADWVAGSSSQDPYAELYSQSSFTVTQKASASLSFSFNGTGVQIFGAKRSNHGLYQISIDATTYPQVNGSVSDQPGDFQTSLFSTVALTNGFHNVTMTNLGSTFLDVDFITWQTPVGNPDEQLLSITSQDSEPSFKYTPESAWNINPANVGMFSGGSGHLTTTGGACAEFTFSGKSVLATLLIHYWMLNNNLGSAVAVFGPVGPNGAPYSVQLDNQSPSNYSANKKFYRPQQMLFQASNLGSGKHTLRLFSAAGSNSALWFAVDFAQVFTTPSLQASDRSASSSLSAGAIAGISIGIVAILVAIIAALIIFLPSKYWKIIRLKGTINDKTTSLPETFNYQMLSNSHSVHRNSIHGTPPTTAPISSSSMGVYPSVSELPIGPNTQVITIPYTSDGKYRPDLPSTPQLLPPPGNRSNPPALHPLRQARSEPQLPPGAAQPYRGGFEEESRMIDLAAGGMVLQRMTLREPPMYER